jgi:hypothetical protein
MNTDTAFVIGNTHTVCQDYATHLSAEGENQIIICDGCSSSPMTDVGARLLALTSVFLMNSELDSLKDIIKLAPAVIRQRYAFELRMNPNMFDSTLLIAKVHDKKVKVLMIGDGVLVCQLRDYSEIISVVYPEGYPYYVSYKLDKTREESFKAIKQIPYWEEHSFTNRYDLLFENRHYFENDTRYLFYREFDIEDFDYITLFSDGIHSFLNTETRKPIKFTDVVHEITDFKLPTGKFVQRRLNKFEKDCKKLGWEHYDDLSMGTIYTGENV